MNEDNVIGARQPLRLANEFETIYLQVVPVGNGRRVEISNARTGTSVLLDATVLAALTVLTPEAIQTLVTAAVEQTDVL